MKHSGHPGKWSWAYSNAPSAPNRCTNPTCNIHKRRATYLRVESFRAALTSFCLSRFIQEDKSVGIKSFGNLQLLISIFLSGEAFISAVQPAPPDKLICMCLSVSYPASDRLHKTTIGLLRIYSAHVYASIQKKGWVESSSGCFG